ncbi:MAG TPA: M1 family aminopeptidase [Oligoflexus sp.]|uniref:ABC transporter permease/M1 family aminopeptidase n=1 Tax=Oligoflexus sp. TaxID=1971216 RepID=UPI002D407868|nr:M1 family aminopeptidase [Oligoflexus sp.]HYX38684.1 M1 family aminopeptidase [Oligoflexus sp.]
MWFEFFKFDLRYQLRQPLLWVVALALGAMAFGAASSDVIQVGGSIGQINRNAPMVIVRFLGVFTVISMFVVTIFIAGPVLRDAELGMSDMIFATPMRKHDYLLGRFLAGLTACLFIFAMVAMGLMIGPYMPWVEPDRVGPFSLQPFLVGFALFVLPNLLFVGTLLMLLAATTRSMLLVYVGIVAFFVLWIVANTLTRDINNEWLAALIDPFGMQAFGRAVRYFSTADANSLLPPIAGFILANRVLWSAIALALTLATLMLFKPQRAGTGRRLFGKSKKAPVSEVAPTVNIRSIQPTPTAVTPWVQCWSILRFDTKAVLKSVPFLVMLLFAIMNFFASVSQSGRTYGTDTYPVARSMLETLTGTFNFMLIIIVTFFAGELIFKERQAKIADVTDAMPIPNWAPLLAKCGALGAVILAFLSVGVLSGIIYQLIRGGAPIEVDVYIKGSLVGALPFVLSGLWALSLQIFTNNKFIGYLLMILFMVAQIVLSTMHFDHNLYTPASLPPLPYSDMNGYGHFWKGWSWFLLYWSLFTGGLMILAQAFWVRGLSQEWKTRVRLAQHRLIGSSGIALILCALGFMGTGVWIFYNTNILNSYRAGDVAMDRTAQYEKLYRQYKGAPHPKITAVNANVDIFPAERRVLIRGHYILQNKTTQPLDRLIMQVNEQVETTWDALPAHEVVVDDADFGFKIIKLNQALAPGDKLDLNFKVNITSRGFTNSGAADSVNLNGTFFNNATYFPRFGYNAGAELQQRTERRKRGLGEPERMAKLEDEPARAHSVMSSEADWVDFETTVSTSADQIAMAPGYLQRTWEENGRRYFHYKMDRPMMNFYAYLSARWEVKKSDWNGIPIEVYYDKKHPYNVDRMIESTKKSLDYYTREFTPYQHRQVRILEFPAYASFAQSFANTIPYSEGIGFIADLRNKDDVDYVFYITAHEMAHQWWGHQVIGAGVQGSTLLMESLSQYAAMMVMEKEYGREKMRRFLRYELDRYLSGRGGEEIAEQPLYRVEAQQYIHYRKGSLVFYRLRDEIGEVPLNRALKRYLQDKGFQEPPFTTSKELLEYIRAEAPADKQDLITDLFEKIVFYDNRVTEATAKQRDDGQWDVTFKLHLSKMEADGKGVESPRVYDEPVELAVFARGPSGKEEDEMVLWTEKRLISKDERVLTVTVKDKPFEVGVDPYNKMIDRVARDNRKPISFE